MSTIEIKNEINKVIDSMPDEVLANILNYVKDIAKNDYQNIKRADNLKRILEEDRELLEKLAR
jgi:hypothetical protein